MFFLYYLRDSRLFTNNGGVERFALLEHRVENDLAELGPHGRLSQLRNGMLGVVDTVRGLVWVENLQIEHTVETKSDVVFCDCALLRYVNDNFLETL